MSDLHLAVQDELDAHRPSLVPPFAAVRARKRSRDRRRLAAGGAALSAVALCAAALVPSMLGGGQDRLPAVASSPAAPPAASAAPTLASAGGSASFTVRYSDPGPVPPATAGKVRECLALPGLQHSSKPSTPPVHAVTVAGGGEAEAEAFSACVRALSADGVMLTEHRPPPLATDADIAAFVESCAGGRQATPVPGYVGTTTEQVLAPGVNSRILGQDGVCNPGSPVPDPTIVDIVVSEGVIVWAGHLAVPDGLAPADPPGAPVPPAGPAGAEICKDTGSASQCYSIDQAQARELGAVLATARRVRLDTPECSLVGPAYTVTWQPRSGLVEPLVWTVPSADCQLMTAGGAKYDLDADGHRAVARAWDQADRS